MANETKGRKVRYDKAAANLDASEDGTIAPWVTGQKIAVAVEIATALVKAGELTRQVLGVHASRGERARDIAHFAGALVEEILEQDYPIDGEGGGA